MNPIRRGVLGSDEVQEVGQGPGVNHGGSRRPTALRRGHAVATIVELPRPVGVGVDGDPHAEFNRPADVAIAQVEPRRVSIDLQDRPRLGRGGQHGVHVQVGPGPVG